MHERHINREQYFEEQGFTTEKYVIPYIEKVIKITPDLTVAEIGCGEGGNLKPFLDRGCKVVGIDLAENKIDNAKIFFEGNPKKDNLTLIAKDIYNIMPESLPPFDLVFMRDTLEHIHNQDAFLKHLKKYIKPKGKIFLAFPPWRMPFGGHQQICESRFLCKLPYFHLLPNFLYVAILKLFGESEAKIGSLLEIKETKISISRFKRILKKQKYKIDTESFYLINPNYEIKFKLKTRKLPFFLNIPFIKDFFTTTYYCVVSLHDN